MPTYAWRCAACDGVIEQVMSIHDYIERPPSFVHCGKHMERLLQAVPGFALHNLVSERHYQGLRATDGSDISSRAKHRDYMKRNNLTTIDDFALTWKREARERQARLAGDDISRQADIARAVEKLGG